jgi:protein involved in polysaccharide export with SLBB domain
VTLAGAVTRPGEYELGPRGSLAELLDLTGGLAQNAAATESRLTRIGRDGVKTTSTLDLTSGAGRDTRLEAADVVLVPSVGVLQDVVEVRGAFNGTGESGKTTTAGKATIVQRLELSRGERVRDVVQKAGGLAPYADLRLAYVERGLNAGPRQRIPVDLQRLLVEKDDTQNIQIENGDLLAVPVFEDRVYVVGEVKTPGPIDFRQDLTPREYVTMAGGPTTRAKVAATTVTFRSGRTFAMAEAPPLEPGAVVTVPEVAIKWWQDYVMIAQVIGSLITAYTGIWVLFNGSITNGN